ncbi:transporter substrate-binding domain-containing protein [Crocinitomicaceae bacterium]|nr:transporter substrate-binding domain-containing protein [Crocinitomicaceae bacterium]
MRHRISTLLIYFGLLTIILSISSCVMEGPPKLDDTEKFTRRSAKLDLPDIIKRGKLVILAENSSTSYFNYKGREMGFEYEILQQFAESIGVELEVEVVKNLDSLILKLNKGEGDLIACNYTITKDRGKQINFSEPFAQTQQVLIQRKPDGWKEMKEDEWMENIITDPSELAQKDIRVWKNSSYFQRLVHLQEEIGDTIFIQGIEGTIGGEELIEMVSTGLIDYTVAEDNIAKVNEQFFDNLYTDLDLSVKQKMAFGLRKSSPLLKAKLDSWLKEFMEKPTYRYIYRKYFEMKHVATKTKNSNVVLNGDRISQFDDLFKKAADFSNWDWRLLASVAYQESKFNPEIKSFGGAYGMMQFMPNTGPHYGVYPDSPPSVQIMGGAKKLMADEKFWKSVPDELERKKFALASYNAGRGHIQDAVKLAQKHGKDPNRWENNVELMLLNLSKQEYYQDPVVRNGMMRGTTTYRYIRDVIERYMNWVTEYD